jgi:hypothetical protein
MKAMRELEITDETIVDAPGLHLSRVTLGSVTAKLRETWGGVTGPIYIKLHESDGWLTVIEALPYVPSIPTRH